MTTETRKCANDIFAQWSTPLSQNQNITLTQNITLKKTTGLGLGLLLGFGLQSSGVLHWVKISLAHFQVSVIIVI